MRIEGGLAQLLLGWLLGTTDVAGINAYHHALLGESWERMQ